MRLRYKDFVWFIVKFPFSDFFVLNLVSLTHYSLEGTAQVKVVCSIRQ